MRVATTSTKLQPRSTGRGFTLIELMIIMVILGVIATIAIPSLTGIAADNRMTGEVNELVVSLTYARNESGKRGRAVTICASDDPMAAEPSCDTDDSDWSNGWIVFVENIPADNARAAGEEVLLVHGPIATGHGLVADAGFYYMTFRSDGTVADDLGGGVTFTLCDDRGTDSARAVIVRNVTGRAVSARKNAAGGALACT